MEYERMKNEARGMSAYEKMTYDTSVEIQLYNIDSCVEYTLTVIRKMQDEIDEETNLHRSTGNVMNVPKNANQKDDRMIIPKKSGFKSTDYGRDFTYYNEFQNRMNVYDEDCVTNMLTDLMTHMVQVLRDTESHREEYRERARINRK
jgi:hypothetical protein